MESQTPPPVPGGPPPLNPYAAPQAVVADFAPSDTLELAGRGMRLAGAIIDTILLMVLGWLFSLTNYYLLHWQQQFQPDDHGLGALIESGWIALAEFLMINGYLLHRSGQTVGKKLLGMRIVDRHGDKPGLFRLVGLRYVPFPLIWTLWWSGLFGMMSVVVMLYFPANYLFIFREDRRCIHDLIAGTRVVLV